MSTGGHRVPGEIAWGTACECHPTGLAPGATHLIEGGAPPQAETLPGGIAAEDDEAADAAVAVEASGFPPFVARPAGLGPVTEIATRLLVAWSSENEGASADVLVVPAVRIARLLLRHTRGK